MPTLHQAQSGSSSDRAHRLKRRFYRAGRRLSQADWFPGTARLAGPVRKIARRIYSVHPPVVEDLAGWCRARGLDVWVISPPHELVRRSPPSLGTDTHPSFERRITKSIGERFLARLPSAALWGESGLVVLPGGEFAAEAVYGLNLLEIDPGYRAPMPSRRVEKSGDYFTLVGKFSNASNYYHWIHDCLLRLHGVEDRLPVDVRYVVPPLSHAYKRETLHLLGLHEEQLLTFQGEEVWEVERLWFASMPPSGAEVPEAVEWLRQRIFSAVGIGNPEPCRRFYISRNRARHARVLNESGLTPILDAHGFEIVETDEMSISEQARLFSQAEAIVAPHGAGQTNMIFADNRCKNLELLEPRWASEGHAYVFWTLAETLGQSFTYLVTDSVPNPNDHKRNDLRVPLDVFESALGVLTS